MCGIYGDGIIALRGAFSVPFADAMREDIETLFAEARQVDGGALPRHWEGLSSEETTRTFARVLPQRQRRVP